MKRGRYWTFALVDPTGGSLLRMSTQNKPDGELWVAFFKQAGCTIEVRVVYPRPRLRSPPCLHSDGVQLAQRLAYLGTELL